MCRRRPNEERVSTRQSSLLQSFRSLIATVSGAPFWTQSAEKISLSRKGKWPAPVLLKYAGVKTWAAFARDASVWNLEENDGVYRIVGHRVHAKGYWVEDPAQKIEFPPGTTIDGVIDRMIAILQDAARST